MEDKNNEAGQAQITKEEYKEKLQKAIDEQKWAEKFLKTKDWQKIARYIVDGYPKKSPYNMTDIIEVREQGGYIRGLMYVEQLLLTLVQAGKEAQEELKSNPDME